MFFPTRTAAETALARILDTGITNVDVGYMQVNVGFHKDKVANPSDLLDPSTNLRVAAEVLRQENLRAGGDIALTVGAYHAGGGAVNSERSIRYQNTVAHIVRRLCKTTASS